MAQTTKALIIGNPVAHARSPLIHAFWLKNMGLAGEYDRLEVKTGAVAAALRALPAQGYAGGNVTVPHKEEAFAACDRVTERARAAGAVNTFWFDDGTLVGDNTDGLGFVSHLEQTYPDRPDGENILVLGAGGAARGLIVPLLNRKPKSLVISNRSRDRAEALVSAIKASHPDAPLRVIAWTEKDAALGTADLLINTTALGMKGQNPLEIDLSSVPHGAIVADIVYVPLETPLLAAARARGLKTLDGLGMLLHQAVPGFERWFGVKPAVTPQLRAHLVADLENKG